jgi:hypothetical protein
MVGKIHWHIENVKLLYAGRHPFQTFVSGLRMELHGVLGVQEKPHRVAVGFIFMEIQD